MLRKSNANGDEGLPWLEVVCAVGVQIVTTKSVVHNVEAAAVVAGREVLMNQCLHLAVDDLFTANYKIKQGFWE